MADRWTKEELWAELDTLGEDKVGTRLAEGHYSDNTRRAFVDLWLRRKGQERLDAAQARSSASILEANRLARSAKNAAWTAAIAAIAMMIWEIIRH